MRRRRRAEAADDRRDELEDRAQPRRRRLPPRSSAAAPSLARSRGRSGGSSRYAQWSSACSARSSVCCAAETSAPPPLTGADETPAGLTRPRVCSAAGASAAGRASRASTASTSSGVTDGAAAARGVAARELGQLQHAGQPRVHALERAVVEERPRRVQRSKARVHAAGLDVAQGLGVERGVQKLERGVALRRVVGERVEGGGELRGVVQLHGSRRASCATRGVKSAV